MKKLIISLCAAASFAAFADTTDEVKKEQAKPQTEAKANVQEEPEAEVEEASAPIFWGFANYGIYSGYQLYGSLLNNEPTLQGYLEGNVNIPWGFWKLDNLGFLGVGVWSNTDLSRRRSGSYGNCAFDRGIGDVFNEWDFNIHWQKSFFFDDMKTWAITYRMYVVWYYYPSKYYQHIQPGCDTTFDYDHYVEITNPYVIPYVNFVREYRFGANLFQFGLKKPFNDVFGVKGLSMCPYIEMVARDSHYNWCFPTQFGGIDTCGGLATLKVELDTTWMFSEHFGLFAKIAYCSIIDHHMRNSCDDILASDDYGENKDFCWGGVGVCCNF